MVASGRREGWAEDGIAPDSGGGARANSANRRRAAGSPNLARRGVSGQRGGADDAVSGADDAVSGSAMR